MDILTPPKPSPRPTSAKARPGGRTHQVSRRIYAASLRLIETRGYAALNFQEVAEAAGVARSTLYRRWASRAELALDAIGVAVRDQVSFPDTGSLEGDLRATLRQIADFIRSPQGTAVLAAGLEIRQAQPDLDPSDRRWARRSLEVAELFVRAKARDEIGATFDWEVAFARAAGALYFRIQVMHLGIDAAWIERIVADVMLGARASLVEL